MTLDVSLTIALCQSSPRLGDIDGNRDTLLAMHQQASEDIDMLVVSELFLCGYPPEDLILHPHCMDAAHAAINNIARATRTGPAILVGCPWHDPQTQQRHNAALMLSEGKIQDVIYKRHLPNHGIFDEKRIFCEAAPRHTPMLFTKDKTTYRLHVLICEDFWHDDTLHQRTLNNTSMLIVLNASPYEQHKSQKRIARARSIVQKTACPLLYVNMVGGQDEILFDGASFMMDATTRYVMAHAWEEARLTNTWVHGGMRGAHGNSAKSLVPSTPFPQTATSPHGDNSAEACDYHGLLCGIRAYFAKSGFTQCLLGLSGGIDSALVAILAVDSLGADNVHVLIMPSHHTSQETLTDAIAMARHLAIHYDVIPIAPLMDSYQQALTHGRLHGRLHGRPSTTHASSTATQNLQARIRGTLLMTRANMENRLLLATGNKSELAMGYATLYGDMCGSLAPLKDVYKTHVYALAHWRQKNHPQSHRHGVISPFPPTILTRPPTAELAPQQKDEDDLPAYALLDPLLRQFIDERRTPQTLDTQRLAPLPQPHTPQTLYKKLLAQEYKRKQAPPGLRLTSSMFGRDRRYPMLSQELADPPTKHPMPHQPT